MKNAIVIALLSLTAVSASAYKSVGADQEYISFTCVQTPAIPDNTISLVVVTGGFAGMTRIVLSTSTIAGPVSKNYYVRQQPQQRQGEVTYAGEKIALAISGRNDGKGNRPATLKLQTSDEVIVKMNCQQRMRTF